MATPLQSLNPETVREIQQMCGLPPKQCDGEMGPVTLRAIFSTLKKPVPSVTATPVPQARAIPLAELVAIAAEGETGVTEQGGNNKGPRIQEYQAATWLEGTGWAWCAAFVCWCVREAIKGRSVSFARPQTAGAWDFEQWALRQKGSGVQMFKPREGTKIKRGDILVLHISHIAIAVSDEVAGYVSTVEGNTGMESRRDGQGVEKKRHPVSDFRSVIRLP